MIKGFNQEFLYLILRCTNVAVNTHKQTRERLASLFSQSTRNCEVGLFIFISVFGCENDEKIIIIIIFRFSQLGLDAVKIQYNTNVTTWGQLG